MRPSGLILLMLAAFPATAAEWVRVPTQGEGDQYFYDRSKLFISGDEITYWKKVAFRSPQPVKERLAASGLYRERIHCAEHTLKLVSYLLYALDGSTIEYVAAQEGEAAPIIPDTVGDVFEKTTCDLVRRKQEEQRRKLAEEAKKPEIQPAAPPALAPPAPPPAPAPGLKTDVVPATTSPAPSTVERAAEEPAPN